MPQFMIALIPYIKLLNLPWIKMSIFRSMVPLDREEARRKYRVLRNESIESLRTAKHGFNSNFSNKLTTKICLQKTDGKF